MATYTKGKPDTIQLPRRRVEGIIALEEIIAENFRDKKSVIDESAETLFKSLYTPLQFQRNVVQYSYREISATTSMIDEKGSYFLIWESQTCIRIFKQD